MTAVPDPSAMTAEQAARLLSAFGEAVTPQDVEAAIAAGAPTSGGKINLLHFAAWMAKVVDE